MEIDLHPSEEMLRMYNLKSYEPVWAKPESIESDADDEIEEAEE